MYFFIDIIIPVLKKSTFAIARKFYKNEPILRKFKNSDEFNRIEKLRDLYKTDGKNFSDDVLINHINFAKGIIEFTSIAGSVQGLSIVAQMVSRPLIRPVLKAIGVDENNLKQDNIKNLTGQNN